MKNHDGSRDKSNIESSQLVTYFATDVFQWFCQADLEDSTISSWSIDRFITFSFPASPRCQTSKHAILLRWSSGLSLSRISSEICAWISVPLRESQFEVTRQNSPVAIDRSQDCFNVRRHVGHLLSSLSNIILHTVIGIETVASIILFFGEEYGLLSPILPRRAGHAIFLIFWQVSKIDRGISNL